MEQHRRVGSMIATDLDRSPARSPDPWLSIPTRLIYGPPYFYGPRIDIGQRYHFTGAGKGP